MKFTNGSYLSLLLLLFSVAIAQTAFGSLAIASQADTEASVVYLKKIRDEDRNYLRQLTIDAAKHIEKSGEFDAKPYDANTVGAVISVSLPAFSFETVKDGMSATEIAGAGLSFVADMGGLFGKSEKANDARNAERAIQNNRSVFDNLKNGEQVKVTLVAQITVVDRHADVDITRTLKVQKQFDSEADFLAEKENMFAKAIKEQLSHALTEFNEEPAF